MRISPLASLPFLASGRLFGGALAAALLVATPACTGDDDDDAGEDDDSDTSGVKACLEACDTPADCASGQTLFEAKNYACTSGACDYMGCADDANCDALSSGLVCLIEDGVGICVNACSAPADCVNAPFDESNYRCEGGKCLFVACAVDADCTAGTGGAGTKCVDGDCIEGCSEPADCAQTGSALGAENWACTDDACEYLGCADDDECAADEVCR